MEATEGHSEAWLTEATTNDQRLVILPECLAVVEVQDADADSC